MQLVVGRVTRPHGVRGEVSVEVRTDDPDLRFAVGRVMATDPAAAGPLTVESVRWHSGRLLIRFAGVGDRNQAEELRGTWLTLDSAEVGPTGDPDEFHDHELIGLAVVTTSGEPVGRVTDVRHFGQDLLVIEPAPARSLARPGAGPAEAGPAGVSPAGADVAEAGAAESGLAGSDAPEVAAPRWAQSPRDRPRLAGPGRPRAGGPGAAPQRAGQRAAGPVRGRDRAGSRRGCGTARHRPPAGAAGAGYRGTRPGRHRLRRKLR